MFTRTNVGIAILLFLLFFIPIALIYGEHGVIVQRKLKEQNKLLEFSVEKKKAEVELLRLNADNKARGDENGELVLAFSDEPFVPVASNKMEVIDYKGLSRGRITLISLIPSVIYLLICFIVRKKRRI